MSGLILLAKILLNDSCSSQSITIMNLQPEISQMDHFSISFGVDKTTQHNTALRMLHWYIYNLLLISF